MTKRRTGRLGRATRLLVLVVAIMITSGVLVSTTAEPAHADNPISKGYQKVKDKITNAVTGSDGSCKPPAVPDHAGSGLPGVIDDKTAAKKPSTLYGKDGWSGLRWNVCDLDKAFAGLPSSESTKSSAETWIGNAGLGVATFEGALITQMQQWAINPGDLLDPVDKFIGKITSAVVAATWTKYAAAIIILAAIGVLMNAMRGEVRRAVKTTGVVLLSCLAIAWVTTPVAGESGAEHAASMFDAATTKINGDVLSNTSHFIGQQGGSTDEIVGATMQDQLVYKLWALGELGSKNAVNTYASRVYETSTVPWSQANNYNAAKKRGDYNTLAQKIKKEDPQAYDSLRGVSSGRAGYGALAAVDMTLIAIPRLPLSVGQVAGLVGLRIIVMFAPILALIALVPALRRIAWSAVKWAMGALASVIIFGVLATVHTLVVGLAATYAGNLGLLTGLLLVFAVVFVALTIALLVRGARAAKEMSKETIESVTSAPGQFAFDMQRGVMAAPESIHDGLGKPLNALNEDDDNTSTGHVHIHSATEFRDEMMPPMDEPSDVNDRRANDDHPDRESAWDDPYYFYDNDDEHLRRADQSNKEADEETGYPPAIRHQTEIDIELPDNVPAANQDPDNDVGWFDPDDRVDPQEVDVHVDTRQTVDVNQPPPVPVPYDDEPNDNYFHPDDDDDSDSAADRVQLNNNERIELTLHTGGASGGSVTSRGSSNGDDGLRSDELDVHGNLMPVIFHPPAEDERAA